MGRGGDEKRGRRFQPGSSSHTQRLPLTALGAGDGPRDVQSIRRDACREEMVLFGANFLKIHNPHSPPAAASRAKQRRAAVGDPEAPGAWNLTSARAQSRGSCFSGSGRRPAPGGAQLRGGAGSATRRGPTSWAPAPAGRAPRVPALYCRSFAVCPPAFPFRPFTLRRCVSESPSL